MYPCMQHTYSAKWIFSVNAGEAAWKVTWNALMSIGGRSEMKPTVSDKIALRPEGSITCRIVGSSVSNSLHQENKMKARDRICTL